MRNTKHFLTVQTLCETVSDDDSAVTREMMSRIADKWSLWVLGVIARSEDAIRFSRIWDSIGEISQKSLTKTLRQLERDGLVSRRMYKELPPRVEYRLTALGSALLKEVEPLWFWVASQSEAFRKAQQRFDRRSKSHLEH